MPPNSTTLYYGQLITESSENGMKLHRKNKYELFP